MPTPHKQSKYCMFIDYTYETLERDVELFDEENMFHRYSPCGKKYIYCLYSYLNDMSLFNLLDLFELKCKTIYGEKVLMLLIDNYKNKSTQCPISPQMRRTAPYKSTKELLDVSAYIINILLSRFEHRENIPFQTMLQEILDRIDIMKQHNFL